MFDRVRNRLSANPIKLSVFDHFVGLALKLLEISPQLCLVHTLAASRYMFKDTVRNSESVEYV